ncbi:hypothetical protein [Serpentinicella alkaliphila]|uniref:DUF948 domain-containing protein n=1 Tax=Serpentinicella alkaliphila TaxID=1734049 RepID=A0A4R2TJP1_9FIRM|nr:hypothetical protein [Serpentinicella alkaliphila]QUH24618.1 hypothetical protein HZR23_01615 [Serpentinicella alkaliphila]TCQ02617.1 hypothetical protein EDD79_101431 [Serpentinicella alkaliphila]
MEFTISSSVVWFLFALVSLGALVLVIIGLLRVNETLNILKGILHRNESNIDESLKSMPKILNNVEEITKEINGEMKSIKEAFRNIDETTEYTASAMQIVSEDILEPIKDVLDIISVVKDVVGRPKKKGIFKSK